MKSLLKSATDKNYSPLVKFCGIRREQDIDACISLKPDLIGFIFAPKSFRYIPPQDAAALKMRLANTIKTVGVFVNESPDVIAEIVSKKTIDIVQLHGSEDDEYIKSLRSLTGDTLVIKAFRIDTKEDLLKADRSAADYILLDSATGGSGIAFDWRVLEGYSGRPYFLAGGLNTENIKNAMESLHPYGLDISSGIETDKYKDFSKMKSIIDITKGQRS